MAKRKPKTENDGLWVAGGVAALYLLTAPPPVAPSSPPPATTSPLPPVNTPPPVTVTPPIVSGETSPLVHYGPGKLNVNSIDGYRRALNTDLQKAPTLMKEVSSYLSLPMGTVRFKSYDGKDWALAVEAHNNHPELGPTNKGVSVFIKDDTIVNPTDTTGLTEDLGNSPALLMVWGGIILMTYKLLVT